MTNYNIEISQRKAAKVAGLVYLFTIIGSLLNVTFVLSKFIVTDNFTVTANNILANRLQFRISITYELFMYVSVIILALTLYIILKPVNRNLALLGLYWRLTEAIMGTVTVFVTFIALQILNGKAYFTVFETKQLHALAGMFFSGRVIGTDIVILFCGIGSITFFYLFFKSKYIPRILAAWGILTYSIIVVYSLSKIIIPDFAKFDIIIYTPGAIFEIMIGIWLLFKGVNIQQINKESPVNF